MFRSRVRATSLALRNHPAVARTPCASSRNAIPSTPPCSARTRPGHARVRALRRRSGPGDDLKAGQKCTAIRRAIVPRPRTTRRPPRSARSSRNRRGRSAPAEACAWGPCPHAASAPTCARTVATLRREATSSSAIRSTCRRKARAETGAFMSPVLFGCTHPLAATEVHASKRSARSARSWRPTPRPNPSRSSSAARVASSHRCTPTTLRSQRTRLRHRAVSRPRDRDRSRRRRGIDGSRFADAATRARRSRTRGRRRGTRRRTRRVRLPATHRDQGSPARFAAFTATGPGRAGDAARAIPSAIPRRTRDRRNLAHRRAHGQLADIEHFAEFTGDKFYAHMDEEAAKANPFFPGRVAHGYLLLSFAAGLFVEPAPGPVLANYGLDNLRFLKPVVPGDSIRVRLTVNRKLPANPNTAKCVGTSKSPTRGGNRRHVRVADDERAARGLPVLAGHQAQSRRDPLDVDRRDEARHARDDEER